MGIKDLTGKTFGKLTVLSVANQARSKAYYWLCSCECGNRKNIRSNHLTSGLTSSCGCLKNAPKWKDRSEAVYMFRLSGYKSCAKRRKLAFTITNEQALEILAGACFYCGSQETTTLRYAGKKYEILINGIDRVDNSKGYVDGNVISCCKICNRAKYDLSVSDFTKWLVRISEKYCDEKGELQVWRNEKQK